MPVSLDILQHKEFWEYYQSGEVDLPDEFLDQFADKTFNETLNEDCHDDLVIVFPSLDPFELELTICLRNWFIDLNFRNRKSKQLHRVAWWDDARWHPFALRWDELIDLYNHWVESPELIPVHPDEAFLLLVKFVGIGNEERGNKKEHDRDIKEAYRALNLLSQREIEHLTKVTLVWPSEDDYAWQQHQDLGWVFGGDYPCYSIRNESHAGALDEDFPFDDWGTLMKKLSPIVNE